MSCDACQTIPPLVPHGYSPKGSYETIAGLKTYVTGPKDASAGVVDIYDIFGMAIQTIQGADILATRLNALVLVPDFFHEAAAKPEWLPVNTDEKKRLLTELMENQASIPKNVEVLREAVNVYRSVFPSVEKWAALGLCWGGKVAVLASGPGAPFIASAQVHPGRMDKADAEKLTTPHMVLASKDEPGDVVQDYKNIIDANGIGGHVETYSTMWHGWMGARADLDAKEASSEYLRGYTQVADFFEKYLL
ncbi:Alpha/Beta hydrolase protein [Aspergillus ambiguus]|uniref:dienelactone hydrolase family protein n=1 Tax=Aspergillus ambiguus TaxID=176160 RepID=UPI003CCD6F09